MVDLRSVMKLPLGAMATMGLIVLAGSLLASVLEDGAQPEQVIEAEMIPPDEVPKYQFTLDRARIVKMQKRHE